MQKKVIIIGIDGADWNVIIPLVKQGKLPNIERLIKEGSWGNLTSTNPPVSPLAWTSISTGKKPEKHGIIGFSRRSSGMYESLIINRFFLKSKTIWELLNENNKTTGILYWLTWPPEKVNGFLVPGRFAPDYGRKDQKTYPLDIVDEIEHLWKPIPSNISFEEYIFEEAENNIITVTKNTIYLMKKYNWNFFAVVFYMTDTVQHNFWKYWEPKYFKDISQDDIKKYGNFIPEIYEDIDNSIGQILSNLDENTIIILVSDHGFQAQLWKYPYYDFDILLEKLNLLKFKNMTDEKEIDWLQTKAYYCEEDIILREQQGICINLKQREESGIVNQDKEFEELKERIVILLSNITILENNEYLFTNIFKEKNINSSIDIKFQLNENISNLEYSENLSVLLPNNLIVQLREFIFDSNISGTHEKNGIFLFHGKDIKSNFIENATVYDITPTVLYLFNLPVPTDMDGRVLTEIIKEDYLNKNPVKYTNESSQIQEITEISEINKTLEEQVKERLKESGYVK